MFIILILFHTISACQIRLNPCTLCNGQICDINITSNITNPIKYIQDNVICKCNNITCGRYCEKSYYTKSDFISCSKKFECNIMSSYFSFILLFLIIALIFAIWIILCAIGYYSLHCDKYDLSKFEDDLIYVSEYNKINERQCDLVTLMKILFVIFCISVIGLTITFIIRIAEANNMNDNIQCL